MYRMSPATVKRKRCPNGTRRNASGACAAKTASAKPRCSNGTRRNTRSGKCEKHYKTTSAKMAAFYGETRVSPDVEQKMLYALRRQLPPPKYEAAKRNKRIHISTTSRRLSFMPDSHVAAYHKVGRKNEKKGYR